VSFFLFMPDPFIRLEECIPKDIGNVWPLPHRHVWEQWLGKFTYLLSSTTPSRFPLARQKVSVRHLVVFCSPSTWYSQARLIRGYPGFMKIHSRESKTWNIRVSTGFYLLNPLRQHLY
jgi:hypothetical protein